MFRFTKQPSGHAFHQLLQSLNEQRPSSVSAAVLCWVYERKLYSNCERPWQLPWWVDSFHHETTASITSKVVVYAPAERAGKESNDGSRIRSVSGSAQIEGPSRGWEGRGHIGLVHDAYYLSRRTLEGGGGGNRRLHGLENIYWIGHREEGPSHAGQLRTVCILS
jgi:hypothetical protein